MKFVTYNLDGSTQPRFGFKKDDYIIDVVRASTVSYTHLRAHET